MRSVVFYFSGNGNTKWVVSELSHIVSQTGDELISIPIEAIQNFNISNYEVAIKNADYIGFATPIYGAKLPIIMKEFLSEVIMDLDNYNGLAKYFFVNTVGYVNGFGVFKANELLKPISKTAVGYVNIKLFNSAPSKKSITDVSTKVYDKRIELARLRLTKLVSKLLQNKRYRNGIGPHLLIGGVIRKLLSEPMKNNYLVMTINKSSCNSCKLCVTNCPTGSIIEENSELIFLSQCTSCMRCYNNCPMNAIAVGKYSKANGYVQYKGIGSFHV